MSLFYALSTRDKNSSVNRRRRSVSRGEVRVGSREVTCRQPRGTLQWLSSWLADGATGS